MVARRCCSSQRMPGRAAGGPRGRAPSARPSAPRCPAPRSASQKSLEPEDLAHHACRRAPISTGLAPVSSWTRKTKVMPAAVDQVVDHPGRDDLAAQRVTRQPVAELCDQRLREVAPQRARRTTARRAAPSRAGRGQRDLRVRDQHRELAARSARAPAACRCSISACDGRNSSARSSSPRASSARMNRSCTGSIAGRLRPRVAEQDVLLVVVAQHEVPRRRRSSRRAARCAARPVELAVAHDPVEQDLDVDLVVGGVDAGGVVDGVGVDPPAGPRDLDPAELGQAEVAALADDPRPQLGAVDPDRVVGLVADVGVGLGARP